MITQYLRFLTGNDYEVEIIDGTIDVIKDGFFHIYIDEDQFTLIGAFSDEEITNANLMRDNREKILNIMNSDADETV